MEYQAERPTINLDRANVPCLRSWMPPRGGYDRFVNVYLFYVGIALFFTILIIIASEKLPEDINWLKILLPVLMSIVLGWAVTSWWEQSNAEESDRQKAITIDDRAEDYIHHIAENWQQTIHALGTLKKEPSSDFLIASNFLLGVQYNKAIQEIERYAIEIDRLGFNSNAFLEEKSARFRSVRRQALKILTALSREQENQWILDVFATLDPELTIAVGDERLFSQAQTVIGAAPPENELRPIGAEQEAEKHPEFSLA
jgi:hypothetical protein